jgi:iron complex outermembrane recepter protein
MYSLHLAHIRRFLAPALAFVLFAAGGVPSLSAQGSTPGTGEGSGPGTALGSLSRDAGGQLGVVEVTVLNRETAEPVSGAMVRLPQVERGALTNALGVALFERVQPRVLTVIVEHIGFAPAQATVEVRADEVARVELSLNPSALHLSGIVVTSTGRARGADAVYQPTTSLSGVALERALASNLAATLHGVPGFHMQYNGPGAASPSIRGMSGDRVLMLEDGNRTGDMYQSAADHGVMVEPLTAQRIEVVRGPAGLLYGSNALGGVVNVIRDDVPRSRPESFTGSLGLQAQSSSPGGGVGGSVVTPAGPLALRVEGAWRNHGDSRTPEGTLPRSGLESMDASLGASWVPGWGFLGVAGRRFESSYGVPGEFDGVLIPGGHPGGVQIETLRTTARARGAYLRPWLGFFEGVEGDASLVRYQHDEIESFRNGAPIFGTRFDQYTADANITARHDHTIHDHPDQLLRAEGALGVGFRWRGLSVGGTSPGTRSGDDWALSALGYEEFQWNDWRLQGGLRYDYRQLIPSRTDSIRVRTDQREVTKPVSERTFHGVSGSVALLRDLSEGWTAGASLARSFRAPSIEELYSDGPHLADFSFDIGSPDLDAETGTGLDLFLRGSRPRVDLEVAAFLNLVNGYIYYAQTAETVVVFRDGAPPRTTPVYEARGDDALFTGVEGRLQWEFTRGFVLDAGLSYTRATRRSDDDPLPFIPPLNGRAELRYEAGPWYLAAGVEGAASQDRIPRPVRVGDAEERPQEATAGYGLVNSSAGWRFTRSGLTHSLGFEVRNLTDRAWRDHLSRIKDIAPQPGRNVQFTYRVYF